MITLQGVIIMRMTDMRTFFNLTEFWEQRYRFLALFKDANGQNVRERQEDFCDTDTEKILLPYILQWIEKPSIEQMGIEWNGNILEISKQPYDLGRLTPHITTCMGLLTSKDIIGLSLLYLFLRADKEESRIEIEYHLLPSLKSGKMTGNFIPLYKDYQLQHSPLPLFPLEYRVLANMDNRSEVVVSCGTDVRKLRPKQCVVGLFHESQCHKLLSNRFEDIENHAIYQLVINEKSKLPQLTCNGQIVEEEVLSFRIGPFGSIIIKPDGEITCPENWYSISFMIQNFKKKYPDDKILDIESETNLISDKRKW